MNYDGALFTKESKAGLGVVIHSSKALVILSLSLSLKSKHWQQNTQCWIFAQPTPNPIRSSGEELDLLLTRKGDGLDRSNLDEITNGRGRLAVDY